MRIHAALIAALLPLAALAQEGLGLDLTNDEAQKKTPPKQETPPPQAPASTEGENAPAAPVSKAQEAATEQAEREVILEDRVKAVQRKVYLKVHRFEVSPYVGVSVNDPYYSKVGESVMGSYYLADTLAIAARFSLIQVIPTDDVRTAKRAFQSRIFFSVPQWSAMGDAVWAPLYGKATIFNTILHFDGYLLGGMGVVETDTSALPGRGPNIAFDLGVGMKFVAKDYLAVNVALINTSYVDTPTGTTQGITQNMMMLNAGFSLFIPFKSTGRESE